MATPRLFSRFRCTGNDWFVDCVNTASLYEAGTMVSYWVNFIHRCLYIFFNIIGWKWEKIFLFLREIMRHFPWFRMLESKLACSACRSNAIVRNQRYFQCRSMWNSFWQFGQDVDLKRTTASSTFCLPVNGSICQFYLVTIAPNFIVPRRGKFSR